LISSDSWESSHTVDKNNWMQQGKSENYSRCNPASDKMRNPPKRVNSFHHQTEWNTESLPASISLCSSHHNHSTLR
jgi:hypothetical protein